MKYAVGSLVSAREREWVVLPGTRDDLVLVKPLDGSDDESTGLIPELEQIDSASFPLPTVEQLGDDRSCRMLRDALRLGIRNSAGPLRSFGRLAFDPRPYQFVPLMLALKLNPIRLLIADDVGIGKTIEASLIVRELLDRGECKRFCILCPPHLAEQWERELYEKFHLEAKPVLSNSVNRLKSYCGQDESIFDVFPYTIVSIDLIKSDKYRLDFLRSAPELILVDEAHSVSFDESTSSRHQRFQLVKKLSENKDRNIILITATPHSGKEQAFRSLLGLLNDEFLEYPADMTGKANEKHRREIAKHLIQRRRRDIEHFEQLLGEQISFPKSLIKDEPYLLSKPYKAFFDKSLDYAREMIEDKTGGKHHQRVRWWSALSLLRALASSPAAAKATLRNRSAILDFESLEEIDSLGENYVLDQDVSESASASDLVLGTNCEPASNMEKPTRIGLREKQLREMLREVDSLFGENDAKLIKLVSELKGLLNEGCQPIVFCRFVQTAEYLGEELRKRLPGTVEIASVSGLLPPEERERRITDLAQAEKRVLVCTDCLSEGINLQESFDSIIHYDLSWNPTRHEQREGRVDRFGQRKSHVHLVTFFGKDNQIDGVVLEVLLKKHRLIKNSLGTSVPVPGDTKAVVEAIFTGLLLRKEKERKTAKQLFPEIESYLNDEIHNAAQQLYGEWDHITEKEKRSRTVFSQEGFAKRVDEIKVELNAVRRLGGAPEEVESFVTKVLKDSGAGIVLEKKSGRYKVDLSTVSSNLRDYLPECDKWTIRFTPPFEEDVEYVGRTHPLTGGLADYIMNTAIDSAAENSLAKRCGVVRTDAVIKRTTLLLLRFRFHLLKQRAKDADPILAEAIHVVGFRGSPTVPIWIDDEEVERVLASRPVGSNVLPDSAKERIRETLENFSALAPHLERFAEEKADQLKEAHTRVRSAMNESERIEVRPELPPDVVGIYVYLP